MNTRQIMTIASFASLAPQAYGLLHRIRPNRRRSRAHRVGSRAGWIGVGMAVGSGLALLLAPRSGPEMRERLGEKGKRAQDYLAPNGIESAGRAAATQVSG